MGPKNLAPPLLEETTVEFIVSGIYINASSSTGENVPVIGRAAGCRVSRDRRTVTLLFTAACAAELLDGIRKTGQIAVVFCQPGTHLTIQLKGTDAAVVAPIEGDAGIVESHCDAFVTTLRPLGYSEAVVRSLMWFDLADIHAVTFTPREAFIQTPGPRAGEPLKGGFRAHAG